jgi:hypothetical protein
MNQLEPHLSLPCLLFTSNLGHAILGLWLWLFDMETTVSPPQGQGRYMFSIRQDYATDAPDHIRWNSEMGS